MSPKKTKKPSAPATDKRDYLPRHGTLPARIFGWLNARPMLFAELSDNAERETGLAGDKLASQLSAALYDLCSRGAVVRIDPTSRKLVPSKNARGALYGLAHRTRALYRSALGSVSNGSMNGAANGAPNGAGHVQLDLTRFGGAAARPLRMPEDLYGALSSQRAAAAKQIEAIDALILSWS